LQSVTLDILDERSSRWDAVQTIVDLILELDPGFTLVGGQASELGDTDLEIGSHLEAPER
jgi:hypothetical protein